MNRKIRLSEAFEIKLSRLGFNAQRSYISRHYALSKTVYICIDFDSKQFASNLIYRYVVPFSRIASGNIEVMSYNASSDKCIVHYVIAVSRKNDDMSYDYIELFDTVVDKSELGDNDQLTEQMFGKYPLLDQILALNEDIQKIVEINKADGVAKRLATDEEWETV